MSGVRKLLADLPNKIRDVLGIQVAGNLRRNGGREFVAIEVPAYTFPFSHVSSFPIADLRKDLRKTVI